jgi:hypothetical protein
LAIEPLIHCVARTELFLAGSTGLLVAACFSEFAVAVLDHLFDSFDPHLSQLRIGDISKPVCIFLILADLKMKAIIESRVIEFQLAYKIFPFSDFR